MRRLVQTLVVAFVLQAVSFAAAASGGGYIEAEGIVYPERGQSINQLRRIAIMDAYRYLAEQVDTIYVSTSTTVRNLRDLNDEINTKVETALRGARVVSVTRAKDGSFHAIVRMSMYGDAQSLAGAVLQEDIRVEDFLKPKFTPVRTEIHYTGLVIDCRGLTLSEAVTPAIKSVGGVEVYAYKNLGYQAVVGAGMVEYSGSVESARAGNTPLVIKAVTISGSCDVVVSDEDADKILAANQSANILGNCAVVLVR